MQNKQTILIIDDNKENVATLLQLLNIYNLTSALNGQAAIDIAHEEEDIDLILLDIMMPKMDGFDVVKIADVIRVEAADNYATVYAIGNKKYVISKTLKYYEDLLTAYGFLRSHKSHLVNLSHIVKYKKGKTGELFLTEGHSALVSTSAKKALMNFFKG